ncbi:MAG: hypothetical protein R3C01_16165 [Planctomycetaceae bacterium]
MELQLAASRFDVQEVIPDDRTEGVNRDRRVVTRRPYRCRFLVKSRNDSVCGSTAARMELLGAFVGSREVKPNQVQDPATSDSLMIPYDINIDRATPSDEEFLLTVQFNWAVTPQPYEAMYGRGKLALPIPRIGGSQAPALVQELRTIVYAPEGFWLVGTPDKFRVEGARPWHHGLFESPVAYIPSSLDRWIEGGNKPVDPTLSTTSRSPRIPILAGPSRYRSSGGIV